MKLSLIFFTFFLLILLSTADQAEFPANSCPTSRHLLFFGGFSFPLGQKKVEHTSSSSKSSSSSTPTKYARADHSNGLTVYIRPQTSTELGQKVHSYSNLLKSKLFTKEELAKLKKLKSQKKKTPKKKNTTSKSATKVRDLVAINDQERDRCRALLQIDHQPSVIPSKTNQKIKKIKNSISTNVKNITAQAKKKVVAAAKTLPAKAKEKVQKIEPIITDKKEKIKSAAAATADKKGKSKSSKSNTKSAPEEKVKAPPVEKKKLVTKPVTPPPPPPSPPPVKEVPVKKTIPPPPPSSPPAPPAPPPPVHTKSKREKASPPPPPVVEESTDTFDVNASDEIEGDDKNNSVVGRAYHFVKNMFQLSDDILENNHTHEEDQIFSSTNEQQHRQSRKILSIEDSDDDDDDDAISIAKRQLLSVKTNKRSVSSKATSTKGKRANAESNKPKVGWAYRYRISRYLTAQKMKRTGRGRGKQAPPQQQQQSKKSSSSAHTKVSKRKLLELDLHDESNLENNDQCHQDIVDTVSITQQFVPKRQLLAAKKNVKVEKQVVVEEEEEEEAPGESDNENENEQEKLTKRRRMKSYESLTDPAEIVRSYDSGLFKPRVGWQFRYRVSRYIDSLRENIREDQERLKLGLAAIKRKTPQELSGRRKRVLDKPFTPETEKAPVETDENKPNVGWRYRYRISKMMAAKAHGEYVDDDELKRQARLDQKKKPQGIAKPTDDDDECVEWEYDIDPELRKIGEEGKRVGWAYRYRIRRKLDELKQRQAETGETFDWSTLGGKREKKVLPTTTSATITSEEKAEKDRKTVGWQYRYRVSKMLEAQKQEATEAAKKSSSKTREHVPIDERLDPVLARLTPAERAVGWQYRYRIRRKLDAIKNATRDTEGGKRGRKSDLEKSSNRKDKEKMIKKVEESIEKILNIDDIEETPFMEYFRRTSSYVFFGLVPAAKKSICLLPLPVAFSFCDEDETEVTPKTVTTTETSKVTKKLRTKKEKRAKQFIRSRSTNLDDIEEKIDDPVKPLAKSSTEPAVEKVRSVKKPSRQRARPSGRRAANEQVKHFDEEEEPVKKLIGVESKKRKNKKRFQIIGQEVKIKSKHSNTSPPPTATIPSTPATATATPVVQRPTPSPKPDIRTTTTTIATTTTPAPLRTISEIIQEEAATLLSTQPSSTEEVKEEINEANENLPTATTTAPSSDLPGSSTSAEDNNDSTTSDSETSGSDSEDDDDDDDDNSKEEEEESEDDSDPSTLKTTKGFYENAKESVHGVFDLEDEKDSS